MLPHKEFFRLFYDTLAAAVSFGLALYLRLGHDTPYERVEPFLLIGTALFTASALASFLLMRTYRHFWRFVSLDDLVALIKAVSISVLIFVPLLFFYNRLEGLPRSIPFIQWLLLMALLTGPRLLKRIYSLRKPRGHTNGYNEKISVLVIGMNQYTDAFLRHVESQSTEYDVKGVIVDDKKLAGSSVRGVRVYSSTDNIAQICEKFKRKKINLQKLIIAPDIFNGEQLQQLVATSQTLGLTVNRLPRINMLEDYGDDVPLRTIAVEDLLGRAQNTLDLSSLKELIKNKRVLITGAGGSIGGELTRQIVTYSPASLVLLENSEFSLYKIDQEMADQQSSISMTPTMIDIRNVNQLESCFSQHQPEIVFHAAALKHVPLCETHASQAAETNILGTCFVAEACLKHKTHLMVSISTDKAVEPSSIMGMTKRVAEHYIQDYAERSDFTKFITVRFGNVLGSQGSVVPLFQKQLEAGGPITITDAKMQRYFMTIREAVQLVLQAATLGNKGTHKNSLYVLDMGGLVYIKDLAEQMIRLAGLKPHEDIRITYTGVRPGEKLIEELFYDYEKPQKTEIPSVMKATLGSTKHKTLKDVRKKIAKHAAAADHDDVIELLYSLTPEAVRPR